MYCSNVLEFFKRCTLCTHILPCCNKHGLPLMGYESTSTKTYYKKIINSNSIIWNKVISSATVDTYWFAGTTSFTSAIALWHIWASKKRFYFIYSPITTKTFPHNPASPMTPKNTGTTIETTRSSGQSSWTIGCEKLCSSHGYMIFVVRLPLQRS